jgi:DNA-binding transcriptional regulator YdaS (Cro superfamily)
MASMPRRRTIYTFDGLIDALDGNKAAAALLDVAPPVVSQWRKVGRIPARRMERIQAELARKGATAVRSLFDFDPPKEYRDDETTRAKRA